MKIAILLGPFQPLPPEGFGAVEKVWCELGAAFSRNGHEVTIIGKRMQGGRHEASDKGPGYLTVRGFDASGRILLDLAKDLVYALRVAALIPRSDVVVTNTFWGPVVLGFLRKWKGRIVVHVARFPKGQMWLYRDSAIIQAISSPVADAIRGQSPGVATKVRVVGYPVDLSIFAPRPATQAVPLQKSILYVGRIHPEKGIRLLIEAFRLVSGRVPDATLKIVGSADSQRGGGGPDYLRSLEAAAAGLRVVFAGAVADEIALAAVYRRAACFCYPSIAERGEAFGRSVLEAMSCGLPCVVSALDCFRDFSSAGENVAVFDHRSADAPQRLSDAICSILGDQAFAARLGSAARTQAERHSLERIADRYLGLFESVVADLGR